MAGGAGGLMDAVGKMISSLMQGGQQGGGGGGDSGSTPPYVDPQYSKPPKCGEFTAASGKNPLKVGDSTRLSWITSEGTPESESISPEVGTVTGNETTVSPKKSVTYALRVQNRAGYTTCKVRVFVGPGDAYSDVTGGETSADTSSDTSEETKDQATLDDPLGTSSSGDTGTGTTKQNTDIVKDSGKSQTGALTYDGFISKYGSKEDLQNDPGAFKEDKDALKADPNAFQISNLQEDEAFDQLATQLGKDGVYSKEDIAQLEQAAREADARAKARKAGSVQDMNDLTPSEVKNLWNRPRESVTGGLTEDILPNDTETNSHSAGIMSRFTHWVKQTFCFWCQVEKVGLIDRGNMLAAAKKPLPASAKPPAQHLGRFRIRRRTYGRKKTDHQA
jgi:hypothetical protein